MYELETGEPLFDGKSEYKIILKIENKDYTLEKVKTIFLTKLIIYQMKN